MTVIFATKGIELDERNPAPTKESSSGDQTTYVKKSYLYEFPSEPYTTVEAADWIAKENCVGERCLCMKG
jgi:hypothetical protein